MESKQRYEGPMRAGMTFEYGPGTRQDLVGKRRELKGKSPKTLRWDFGDGDGNGAPEEFLRNCARPVRPTTKEGWELFVPPAALPETSAKDGRVGQVWAVAFDGVRAVIELREDVGTCSFRVNVLAGNFLPQWWASNTGTLTYGVLLFDAPAEAEKPAGPLARGWDRIDPKAHTWFTSKNGAGLTCWYCHEAGRGDVRADYFSPTEAGDRYHVCTACAVAQGAFGSPQEAAAPECKAPEWCGLATLDDRVPWIAHDTKPTYPGREDAAVNHVKFSFCSTACLERNTRPPVQAPERPPEPVTVTVRPPCRWTCSTRYGETHGPGCPNAPAVAEVVRDARPPSTWRCVGVACTTPHAPRAPKTRLVADGLCVVCVDGVVAANVKAKGISSDEPARPRPKIWPGYLTNLWQDPDYVPGE